MTQQHNYWRADITGLRALVVIPVVLYHAFPGLMPGGFVGVDIFFVISGYLISGIIFRSLIAKNKVDYVDFYAKRIRRILPNLLLLLSFCLVVGYFFLFDDELKELSKQVYSSAGFYQNFRLLEDVDYFAPAAERQPLLHLWSLAIEEQFYIFFPLLCGLIWRFTKSVRALGILVGAITLGSLAFCLSVPDQRFNFYFPLTRFWELGFGIVLSYAETFRIWSAKHWALSTRNGMSFVALLMLVAAFLGFDHDTVFPGIASLLPVFGAVLLISSHEDAVVNRWLTGKPVVFVGLISYSLYLWHWPFLVFQELIFPESSTPARLLTVALSVIVSFAIYIAVENPVRHMKRKSCLVLLGLLMLMAGFGLLTNKLVRKGEVAEGERLVIPWAQSIAQWRARLGAEFPWVEKEGLLLFDSHPGTVPEILWVGDSHTGQYAFRIRDLALKNNISVRIISGSGCFAGDHIPVRPACARFVETWKRVVEEVSPKKVVLSQYWTRYLLKKDNWYRSGEGRVRFDRGGFALAMGGFARYVDAHPNVRFFVLEGAPAGDDLDIRMRVNRLSRENINFDLPYWVSVPDGEWVRARGIVKKALQEKVEFVSYSRLICPGGLCDARFYMDSNHLSPIFLRDRAVWLDGIFE